MGPMPDFVAYLVSAWAVALGVGVVVGIVGAFASHGRE